MFNYLSSTQLDALYPKLGLLREVLPQDLIAVLDYDLTMAKKKNPANFDDAPLEEGHHSFLQTFCPNIGGTVVLTARGEASTEAYLNDHGKIENLSLASNSGHLWRPNIASPETTSSVIAIPAYEQDPALLQTVVNGIHGILENVKDEYINRNDCSLLITDKREMCGAVIYQLKGAPDTQNVLDFHARVEELKQTLGDPAASLIDFAGKDRSVVLDGETWTQGYIDFKPAARNGLSGMNKGHTTDIILNTFGLVTPRSVLLVAGDSNSDYPMMQIATQMVCEGKIRAAICIDVGGEIDDKDKIMDVAFAKNTPTMHAQIDLLYRFMGDIKACCAPSRDDVISSRHKSKRRQVYEFLRGLNGAR